MMRRLLTKTTSPFHVIPSTLLSSSFPRLSRSLTTAIKKRSSSNSPATQTSANIDLAINDPIKAFEDFFASTTSPAAWRTWWDPFSSSGLSRLNRIFGDIDTSATAASTQWRPRVDVSETDQAVVVHAELPGVKPQDVKVMCKDGILTIEGERKHESSEEGGEGDRRWTRRERIYGRFHRNFQLPDNVATDPSQIIAKFKDGILSISLPKMAETKPIPHQIPVIVDNSPITSGITSGGDTSSSSSGTQTTATSSSRS